MERFLPIAYLIGWFAAVFLSSYLINWLLVRGIVRRYYRLFVAPGVIVHELSHAAGCLITGSEITEINFWKASGGHVKHRQPTEPLRRMLSDPLIALAPIWGSFLFLALLTWLMVPNLFFLLIKSSTMPIWQAIDWSNWQTWLYLYLVTSLMATVAPSATDIRYALASLVILGLVLSLGLFIPGMAQLLLSWGTSLQPFALFTLILLLVGLIIAFLLAIPNRRRRSSPPSKFK